MALYIHIYIYRATGMVENFGFRVIYIYIYLFIYIYIKNVNKITISNIESTVDIYKTTSKNSMYIKCKVLLAKDSAKLVGYSKLRGIKIRKLPTDIVAPMVRASARQTEVLGSDPSECYIFNCSVWFFLLCYTSSVLDGTSNFDLGMHNSIMFILRKKKIKMKLYIYIY